MCAEIYQQLKKTLAEKEYATGVGDEGGFAPNLNSVEEALALLQEATQLAAGEPWRSTFLQWMRQPPNCMMKIPDGIISSGFDERRKFTEMQKKCCNIMKNLV